MKSIFRIGALVLLVAFAFVPAIKSYAQNQMCFGLADADCGLFYSAFTSANLAKLTSFQMDYSLNVKGSGGGSGGEFHVTGSGSFGIDTKAASSADSSNPMGSLSALMFSNVIKGSGGATGGQSQNFDVEVRIVGGNVYFKSPQFTKDKWQYTTAADLSAIISQYATMMGSMSSGGSSGGSSSPMGAMSSMNSPEMQKALAAIPSIPGGVVATASDGGQVDGVATKKVTITVDLVKIIQAPEMRPAIEASLKQNNPQNLTADQAVQLASTALKDSKVQFWGTVGTDGVLRGIGLTLAFNIDDATAKAMNMTSGGGSANVDFAFNISKVGQPVTVEAPTGAEKLTLPGSSK